MTNAQTKENNDQLDPKVLLAALNKLKSGDFSIRLPEEWTGIAGKIAAAFNEIAQTNEDLLSELKHVSDEVGKEGKLSARISTTAKGQWKGYAESVNQIIENMAEPLTEVSRVVSAVANGDLSQSAGLELDGKPLRGEFLKSAKIVNTMVNRLNSFASEVTRVAREVGSEGKLGGQAVVPGVSGTWKDLTDNVNFMAANLTNQVRNIAEVTTAVAKGDLSKKITVEAQGKSLN